jgi:hypothetical protein
MPVVTVLIAAVVFLAKAVFSARTLTMIAAIARRAVPAIAATVIASIAPTITSAIASAIAATVGPAIGPGLILRIVAVAPLVLRPVETAHGVDHAQVMLGVLIVGFSRNPITHRRCFARQDLVLFEYLVRVAPHPNFGPAAVEGLITLRLVVRFATATTATTAVAAALAATLIIVRSHIRLLPK